MSDDIRTTVRDKYGKIALAVTRGGGGCCGERCDLITADLYQAGETAGLPAEAVQASLGCGNPTALAELRSGEVVLDLGSGGGIDVLLSARRVAPTGKAYGLDMTDEMLALARDNARKAGASNVEFLKGEIEHVPLPDASVDVVISNCVINLSPDKDRVLAEAFRVLRPGGRFAVSDVVIRGEVPADLRRSVALWIGCVAGALEESEYREKLARAGFTDIDIEPTRIYHVDEARELLAGAGIDAAALAPLLDGKFMSAFVRARKPGPTGPRAEAVDVQIDAARPGDLDAVLALLDDAAMPRAGVTSHFGEFLMARAAGRVVGAVGLERYGPSALLRSLVVAAPHRGRNVGTALTQRALEWARAAGVAQVFLLTTTASDFFRRFGFRPIDRDAVDPTVRASGEFAATACQSAVAMRLDLGPRPVALVPRVHTHLGVTDLARSRAFYEKFLGAAPVKVKPGYVKFLPPWAPLNLALSEDPAASVRGWRAHLGLQLGSRTEVVRQLERVKAAGLPVREEFGVDCCHANQDKFWVEDPDGVEWEVYVLNRDLEAEPPAVASTRGLRLAQPGACCGTGQG
jgi:N-acetylglutamate synthase-like GNAT family acetyltransferase/2-polyprenyl-3-methyl-5-hydroxy-6-metoxy-1,4-benzoquinol methylase/catechol 2,3-dioxygenase-like lactoylglutathione lyase family enzyme